MRGEAVVLVLLALASHGLTLVNGGVFWDDWVLWNMSPDVLVNAYAENGLVWPGYFFGTFFSLPNGIWLVRTLVFTCYLVSAFAVYGVVRELGYDSERRAFWMAATFLLVPVNLSRVALISAVYALPVASFSAGCWLAVKWLRRGGAWRRVASLATLAFSMTISSLLVLYSMLLLWFIRAHAHQKAEANLARTAVRVADFVLLPAVMWAIRSIWWQPHGIYAGYNDVTASGLLNGLWRAPAAVAESVGRLAAATTSGHVLWVTASAMVVATVLFVTTRRSHTGGSDWHASAMIMLGLTVLVVSIYSYAVVGKAPGLTEWADRHQLLMPFGYALLIPGLVSLVLSPFDRSNRARSLVLAALMVSFVAVWLRSDASFLMDWEKQKSQMVALAREPRVRGSTTIVLRDKSGIENALHRSLRFYEWAAQMKLLFGDETRLVVEETDWRAGRGVLDSSYYTHYYSLEDYRPGGEVVHVTLVPGADPPPGTFDLLSAALRANPIRDWAPVSDAGARSIVSVEVLE